MFGGNCEFNGVLIYIDGLVDNLEITESILKPIILNKNFEENAIENFTMMNLKKSIICSGDITESSIYSNLFEGCLSGNTILLVDGLSTGLVISTKRLGEKKCNRTTDRVCSQRSKEGFTEDFRTNTSL